MTQIFSHPPCAPFSEYLLIRSVSRLTASLKRFTASPSRPQLQSSRGIWLVRVNKSRSSASASLAPLSTPDQSDQHPFPAYRSLLRFFTKGRVLTPAYLHTPPCPSQHTSGVPDTRSSSDAHPRGQFQRQHRARRIPRKSRSGTSLRQLASGK